MANSVIVGQATIYGVDGTVIYGTVAVGDNYMQSCNVTDEADTAEARNERGNVFGYNLYNFRRLATFEIVFVDTTEEAAAAEVEIPVPGAIVTIGQTDEGDTDKDTFPSILIGGWNYVANGQLSMTNTDILRLTLPCSKFNNDTGVATHIAMQTFGH